MSRFTTLSEWLDWLEQLHPVDIDLGLERVYTVASRLGLLQPTGKSLQVVAKDTSRSGANTVTQTANKQTVNKESKDPSQYRSGRLHYASYKAYPHPTVVTVAGTNGKGSCIQTLEQALLLDSGITSGPKVGAYTSPHLHHYCERIRIDGEPVAEHLVCDAFSAIDKARADSSLTYFEFGTLAALWIFAHAKVPFVLLEVGLGGRLDAVNIVDADIAVITSIAIDHEAWLGNDRNTISQEKLGVSRPATPLIIAEQALTSALEAACQYANTHCIDRDFSASRLADQQWLFTIGGQQWQLPLPHLPLNSVAAALAVLVQLERLPAKHDLTRLITDLSLAGRYQRIDINGIEVIFDVAHNPAAASALAERLQLQPTMGNTFALMAVMADKDISHIIEPMVAIVDQWFLGDLSIPRAAESDRVKAMLLEAGVATDAISLGENINEAFQAALAEAQSHDRIVVFGSFYTVAAVLAQYQLQA